MYNYVVDKSNYIVLMSDFLERIYPANFTNVFSSHLFHS